MPKIAHHIRRCQVICQIQMLSHPERAQDKKTNPTAGVDVSWWGFVPQTCMCDDFVYSHCVLFRPCLFWAELLCSFPRCCPHTLWRAASCCLISRPSDTNVPSAHQGVHSQQQERSPCSSFFYIYISFPPSLCFWPAKTHNLPAVEVYRDCIVGSSGDTHHRHHLGPD